MRNNQLFSYLVVLASIIGFATKSRAIEPDSLAWRLAYQVWSYPQEKVYVATDRDIYAAGDTIRFRAFLVDATFLNQKRDGSKYVYVELTDPFGETVRRIKVVRKEGIFAGYMPLDEEMPEGSYTLGGYTLYMKNQGDEYVFRKVLPIKSQMAKKYELKTQMEGNTLVTSLYQRLNETPVNANNVSLYSKNGPIREDVHKRSSFGFRISNNVRKGGVVKVKYDRYEKFVKLPPDSSSFAISFHPEGGYLIPNVMNRIGFKAVRNNGLGRDVTGELKDEEGNKVTTFKSSHCGMGSFSFIPKRDVQYVAEVNGKSFPLPLAEPSAAIITIPDADADSVTIKLIGKLPVNSIILANNSGVSKYASFMKSYINKIGRKELGQGIVQLLLLDEKGKILSSRLVFNRDGYIYGDSIQNLPKGDYAVSVRSKGSASGVGHSIVSELMLQSELKGHIENPDYYFESDDAEHNQNLDNLLLTQGWERYDLPDVLAGNFAEPKEPMEIGGALSGTVKSRWVSKPLKDAAVNVIAPGLKYVNVATTDSLGRFIIEGLDWQNGTVFALRAFNKNGNPEHNLEIDADVKIPIPSLSEEYISNSITDEYKFSNGAIWLDELEVKAYKSDEELKLEMLKALGVKIFSGEEIEANNYTTYDEIIRKIPGLRIENGNLVRIASKANVNNRHAGNVELWVDGVQWTPTSYSAPTSVIGPYNTFTEFSGNYPINIMESIHYYKPSTAMIISSSAASGAGALVMTTKDGTKIKNWDKDLFVKCITPIGYQKATESYKPHFFYDPVSIENPISSAWYPSETDFNGIIKIPDSNFVVNGISNNCIPVFFKN